MGNTDSKQQLGQKVKAARKKLEEDSKTYSERADSLRSKSSKMSDYMVESISNTFKECAPFMSPTLLTAWYSSPVKCEAIVLNACRKVLNAPIKKEEWDWFGKYVLPSTIWLLKSNTNENKYMYEQLIDIANEYSDNMTKSMDSIYDTLKHQPAWKALMEIKNETFISRQDHKKVGLLAQDAILDAKEAKSEEEYELQSFLDSNWSLNSLLSVAKILNDEFQNHIKTVISHYGDFKNGPLKKIERCQSKMENDYSECAFPKAAKLLDIIRCSCTFNTVEQLVNGYEGLIKHIKKNSSMLEVARIKNGFLERGDGGYRDLKMNVVYHSPVTGISMVCEVQLLLVNYLWEKKKIHKLYNVSRQEEYFKMVVHEDQENGQKVKATKDMKLIPALNFKETIEKEIKSNYFYKCSVDSELNLLAIREHNLFSCVSLSTNKIIFKQDVKGGLYHSHHWINVNGTKHLTIQTDTNIIDMYKVDNDTFEKDSKLQIKVNKNKQIKLIEFDRKHENAFLIIDGQILQQRTVADIDNVVMEMKLPEQIDNTELKQLCLADNGECCVVAGGNNKNYFYFIDLIRKQHYKLESNVLVDTYAPCFINGEPKYVSIGDYGGKIEIWDITKKISFKVISEFKGYIGAAMSTRNILAVASGDKTIKLWDVRSWEIFYSDTFKVNPMSLHLTSDAKYLTIGGQNGEYCVVWKIE